MHLDSLSKSDGITGLSLGVSALQKAHNHDWTGLFLNRRWSKGSRHQKEPHGANLGEQRRRVWVL